MSRSNNNLKAVLQDTADAIRAKTGSTSPIVPRDFADEIGAIQTGGGSSIVPGPNDNVIVYDYDGTILDAKQVAVGAEYTLPEGPTHDGLTFDGWSCSTASVNGKITIPASKQVRVGALYHTTSGKLEMDVYVPKNIEIRFQRQANSGFSVVDWGDGTIDNDSNTYYSHTYAIEGNYTIKITMASNEFKSADAWQGSLQYPIFKSIRLPNTITILNASFANLNALVSVTIPSSVTTAINAVFSYCSSLKAIIYPKVNPNGTIANSAISNTDAKIVVIPDGISELSPYAFNGSKQIEELVLPNTITSFRNYCIQTCQSLVKIVYLRIQP